MEPPRLADVVVGAASDLGSVQVSHVDNPIRLRRQVTRAARARHLPVRFAVIPGAPGAGDDVIVWAGHPTYRARGLPAELHTVDARAFA